ncbi:MAG: alpha/beta hydrolase [Leptospirales bacterium]|nr:alpha/beta hydrolase [Leptospirales bacterium]
MTNMDINGITFSTGKWPLNPAQKTLIFIHGASNSKNLWDKQIDGLCEDVNTIAIDLPGHGDSTLNGMDSVNSYANSIEEFITKLNPPFPIPCGLSLGGGITLQLIINNNIKFKAGIIINSGAKLKVMPAIFDLIKNNYSQYVSSLPAVGISSKTDISLIKNIIDSAQTCNPETAYNDFIACNNFDVTDKLSHINIPVLILTAEEDKLTPKKYGEFLLNNIAGSSLVNIQDAGHFSPVEQHDKVNDAIKKFIDAVSVS